MLHLTPSRLAVCFIAIPYDSRTLESLEALFLEQRVETVYHALFYSLLPIGLVPSLLMLLFLLPTNQLASPILAAPFLNPPSCLCFPHLPKSRSFSLVLPTSKPDPSN